MISSRFSRFFMIRTAINLVLFGIGGVVGWVLKSWTIPSPPGFDDSAVIYIYIIFVIIISLILGYKEAKRDVLLIDE
jgi:hypothetical protein